MTDEEKEKIIKRDIEYIHDIYKSAEIGRRKLRRRNCIEFITVCIVVGIIATLVGELFFT